MRSDGKPDPAGAAPADYAMFLAGLRVVQATSPTARAQRSIAGDGDHAAPDQLFAGRNGQETVGSYRRFSRVTNGKRT